MIASPPPPAAPLPSLATYSLLLRRPVVSASPSLPLLRFAFAFSAVARVAKSEQNRAFCSEMAGRGAGSEQNRAFCSEMAGWRPGNEQNKTFCSDLAGWGSGSEQNKAFCSEMAGQKPENEQNRAFCSDFSGQCHRGGGFLAATRLQRWLTSIGQTKEGKGKRK